MSNTQDGNVNIGSAQSNGSAGDTINQSNGSIFDHINVHTNVHDGYGSGDHGFHFDPPVHFEPLLHH